jgi:hypothetical protein
MFTRILLTICILTLTVSAAMAGTLFVGLEGSTAATQTSDLDGFPNVHWTPGFAFDVSGAASRPDGQVYLCNGAFTTRLYLADMAGHPPVLQSTISVDIHGLAYGRDKLYGFSNYATPKGIYSIDPASGVATLVLDCYTGTSFRFFALDYNPADDLLYGYTEYGNTGLYSINIDTGEMIEIADPFPASNSSGRALAVGNNTVYILATRGDDGIDGYAYDLSQGIGGDWAPFTNPYPQYHSTGGAAFIHDPLSSTDDQGMLMPQAPASLLGAQPNPFNPMTKIRYELFEAGAVHLGVYDLAGRRVRTLRDGIMEQAGQGEALWDGRDDSGRGMPSGTYLYRLEVGSFVETRRMALVR